MIALAAVLGLGAVVLFRGLLRPKASAVAVTIPMASVVAAAHALKFGDKIAPDTLTLIQVPPSSQPAGSYRSVALAVGTGERVALRTIGANEIVTETAISAKGVRLSMLGVIGPAMRAVSVVVTEPSGVAGLVSPGDRVDVFVTYTPPEKAAHAETTISQGAYNSAAAAAANALGGVVAPSLNMVALTATGSQASQSAPPATTVRRRSVSDASSSTAVHSVSDGASKPTPISELLVQNARVLAVGQNSSPADEKPVQVRTATLEVSADQAAKLVLGSNLPSGTLTLVLRALTDESRSAVPTTHMFDLRDGPRRLPPSAPVRRRAAHVAHFAARAAAPQMEVTRGSDKGAVTSSYAVPRV